MHYKPYLLILLTLAFLSLFKSTVAVDTDIIDLDDATFEAEIKKDKFLLVLFHASWCKHSKAFLPRYRAIFNLIKSQKYPITVSRLNIDEYPKLKERFRVAESPTIRVYKNDRYIQYDTGVFQPDYIMDWLKNSLDINVKEIDNLQDFEIAISMDKDVSLIYFDNPKYPRDEKKEEIQIMHQVSQRHHHYMNFIWARISNETLMSKDINFIEKFAVFARFYNGFKGYDKGHTFEGVENFISQNFVPHVSFFNEKSYHYLLNLRLPLVLLTFPNSTELFDGKKPQDKAIELADKILDPHFALIFTEDISLPQRKLLNYLDYDYDTTEAQIRILDPENKILRQYKLDKQNFSVEAVFRFTELWRAKLINPKYRSEKEYGETTELIPRLVGNNFNKFVRDPTKNVVVFFSSSNCGRSCDELYATLLEVAADLQTLRKQLSFYQIDLLKNDVPGYEIQYIPSVALFPKRFKEVPLWMETNQQFNRRELHNFIVQRSEFENVEITEVDDTPAEYKEQNEDTEASAPKKKIVREINPRKAKADPEESVGKIYEPTGKDGVATENQAIPPVPIFNLAAAAKKKNQQTSNSTLEENGEENVATTESTLENNSEEGSKSDEL